MPEVDVPALVYALGVRLPGLVHLLHVQAVRVQRSVSSEEGRKGRFACTHAYAAERAREQERRAIIIVNAITTTTKLR